MSTHDPALFPNLTERTALDALASCYDSLGACLAALEILEAGAATGDATAIRHSLAHLDRQVKEAAAHLAPALRALIAAAQEPAPAERQEPAKETPADELPGFPAMDRARHAHATGNGAVMDDEMRRWFVYRDPLSVPAS